jgi:hypothetical protein
LHLCNGKRRHIRVQRRFRGKKQQTNFYHAVLHLDTMDRIDAIRAERYTTPHSGFDTRTSYGDWMLMEHALINGVYSPAQSRCSGIAHPRRANHRREPAHDRQPTSSCLRRRKRRYSPSPSRPSSGPARCPPDPWGCGNIECELSLQVSAGHLRHFWHVCAMSGSTLRTRSSSRCITRRKIAAGGTGKRGASAPRFFDEPRALRRTRGPFRRSIG